MPDIVDTALLTRTREWLLNRRDGKGGFKRNERALDSFGRAPPHITDAYIVWSLLRAGVPAADLVKEIAKLRAHCDVGDQEGGGGGGGGGSGGGEGEGGGKGETANKGNTEGGSGAPTGTEEVDARVAKDPYHYGLVALALYEAASVPDTVSDTAAGTAAGTAKQQQQHDATAAAGAGGGGGGGGASSNGGGPSGGDLADAARRIARVIASSRQQKDGRVTGAATSITSSGGDSLTIETTAVAILAWLHDDEVRRETYTEEIYAEERNAEGAYFTVIVCGCNNTCAYKN
jgi:hypothetical protein